jgi:hypothetical protein
MFFGETGVLDRDQPHTRVMLNNSINPHPSHK